MSFNLVSNQIVYLDYAATTPCDPRVVKEMAPYWSQEFGNPSSPHLFGQLANQTINDCRMQISEALHGSGSVVFTSGSTESNNLAILSLLRYSKERLNRQRILCLTTEHKSITNSVTYFGNLMQMDIEWAPVNRDGTLDLMWFSNAMDDSIGAVIIQLANSETGVIQDVSSVSELCHKYRAVCFSDITQAVGKIPIDLDALGVDYASFTAHKFYGPKGIGALYVAPKMQLAPVIFGGGQERGIRPGTENVPGVVGIAVALKLSIDELGPNTSRISYLRNQLWKRLKGVGEIQWNSKDANLLPSHLNVTIRGVNAQDLMLRVRNIAFSAGSACNTTTSLPSPVLLAMGLSKEEAEETIRLTIGRFTTENEIYIASNDLIKAISDIRLS